jgi:hypothetical protein
VECEATIAGIKQLKLFDSVNLHDVETADAHEPVRGQSQCNGVEGTTQEMGSVAHPQSDVIVRRFHPINIIDFEKNHFSVTLHGQESG